MRPGHRKENSGKKVQVGRMLPVDQEDGRETRSAELHGEWKRRCLASWAVVNGF